MTMPYSSSRATFLGNGVAVDFPFSFRVWGAQGLAVSVISPQGEAQIVTAWTVTLNTGDAVGGVLHYTHEGAPLPVGWKLSMERRMPFTQEIALLSGARFDPQVIEDGLDRACAERQQLLDMVTALTAEKNAAHETASNTTAESGNDTVDTAQPEAQLAALVATMSAQVTAQLEAQCAADIAAKLTPVQQAQVALEEKIATMESKENSNNDAYAYVTEFRNFFEQEPPPGWAERNGQTLSNADTLYPKLWAALHREDYAWKCKTAAEWETLSTAAGGVGGVPFFCVDAAAKSVRLPDTRGDYERCVGGASLSTVGEWQADAFKAHSHLITAATGTGTSLNAARGSTTAPIPNVPSKAFGDEETRPRSFGVLGCVYIG